MIGLNRWNSGQMMVTARATMCRHTGCTLYNFTNYTVPWNDATQGPWIFAVFYPFFKNCRNSATCVCVCVCVSQRRLLVKYPIFILFSSVVIEPRFHTEQLCSQLRDHIPGPSLARGGIHTRDKKQRNLLGKYKRRTNMSCAPFAFTSASYL